MNNEDNITYENLGYSTLLTKEMPVGISDGITNENVDAIVGSGAVGFDQTTMDVLHDNQDMKSSDFVTGSAGWQIKGDGSAEFSDIVVRGTIYATLGEIGGFTIGATTISSASDEIILDSANKRIDVGTTNKIFIDGENKRIQSDNYVSGAMGAGFHLSDDLLEVGNIACRGLIRTAVFQKSIINVMGGNFLVLDGDVLNEDTTALDASTLKIKGVTTFSVNDILRIKNSTEDEWFKVTAVNANTYTVERDKKGDYTADNNPVWKKGASIVNYGQSGDGGIFQTASESNAPYLSVFTHAGNPWLTTGAGCLTTRLRIGNLNGYLGYTTDKYGVAIGETDRYLKYDPTNGVRVKGSMVALVSLTAGEAIAQYEAVRIHTDGKIYKASAITSDWANLILGFAVNAIAKDATGDIQLSQQFITTGLTVGKKYYIEDGTIDQSKTTGDDTADAIWNDDKYGQTFTTGAGVSKLDWIEIYAKEEGDGCGNLYFEIYATSSGIPTGSALGTSETLDTGDWGTDNKWHIFRFLTPVTLSASTMYALVAVPAGGSISNNIHWRVDNPGTPYTGGTRIYDTGSGWTILADDSDFLFKTAYTTGAISITAGTVTKKIGISLAATKLFIQNS